MTTCAAVPTTRSRSACCCATCSRTPCTGPWTARVPTARCRCPTSRGCGHRGVERLCELLGLVRPGQLPGRAVPTPEEFRAGTGDVARLHRGMLKAARKASGSQQGFQREMKVALVLESAGIALQVTAGEEVSLLAGSLQMATALAGALSVRLEFFDREGRGRAQWAGALADVAVAPAAQCQEGLGGDTEVLRRPRRGDRCEPAPQAGRPAVTACLSAAGYAKCLT